MAPLHFCKTSLAFKDHNQGYDCIQLVGIRFNLLGISMMRNAFITENRPHWALQNPGTQENALPPVENSVSLLSHKGPGYPMGFQSQNAFVEYSATGATDPPEYLIRILEMPMVYFHILHFAHIMFP